MNNTKTKITIITLALICAALTGCQTYSSYTPEFGHYYINPNADLASIARVVILEPVASDAQAALTQELCDPLTDAFRKRHIFSATPLTKNDPDYKGLDIDQSSMLTIEKMGQIRQQLKADAIITGTVTRWHPYPHLTVGLHLKMTDLRTGHLIWAIDQLWDSTDKRTEQRMRMFFDKEMRTGYQPMDWHLLVSSPRAFMKFITYEVAETFPGFADQARAKYIVRK